MPMLLLFETCSQCNGTEERTFRDSWTGLELCAMCLSPVIEQVTMSPATEGDNLQELLERRK